MADLDYIKSLDDYDDIKDYLELEGIDKFDQSKLPVFQPDFSTCITVDNIPAVPKEKIPKLMQVLMKIYLRIAPITEEDIYMPFNEESGTTYGFCYVRFASKENAEEAVKVTQGFAIDKKHSFQVNMYADLDRYASIPEEYVAPTPPPFNPRPDPTSWLTDTQCRDQLVVRYGPETEIFWCNHTGEEPTLVYGGEEEKKDGKVWCESYVTWSPQGTYLATFHAQGIKLWGSTNFESAGRFMHPRVEELAFSPCENYIITYRYTFHENLNPAEAIIVWDVRDNTKLRTFELKNPLDLKFQVQAIIPPAEDANPNARKVDRVIRGRVMGYSGDTGCFTIQEGNTEHKDVGSDKVTPLQEPNRLKWSPDGKYLARLGADILTVYEMPSMTLMDKKSISTKEMLDFAWSPKSNLISYWTPSVGNYPAMINIIQIPTREDVCSRKMFEVQNGRMVWQNDGEFLCVHMTKMQGKKKSYVLMFFRVKDAGVPVEQIELQEPILHVSWEPSGDKIVIMHGEPRSPSIAFYSMASKVLVDAKGAFRQELTHLFTKTGVQCNEVLWSPAGGVVALAYFAPDTCIFELHDVESNTQLAAGLRHDRCSRLYWDPSGRFIASCTITDLRNSAAKANFEDGFNVYTFQGKLLFKAKKEKLYQFSWRPRPKGLLSSEERKKVIKNLRKFEKMFEREDRQKKQELNQEVQAARFKQAEGFLAWLNRNRAIAAAMKPQRVALRGGYDSDDDRNYLVELVVDETVLKSSDQIVQR